MSLFSEYVSKVEKEATRAVPADIKQLVERYQKAVGMEKQASPWDLAGIAAGAPLVAYGGAKLGRMGREDERSIAVPTAVGGLVGGLGGFWPTSRFVDLVESRRLAKQMKIATEAAKEPSMLMRMKESLLPSDDPHMLADYWKKIYGASPESAANAARIYRKGMLENLDDLSAIKGWAAAKVKPLHKAIPLAILAAFITGSAFLSARTRSKPKND